MNERSNKKRNAAFIIGIPALALAALLACGGLIYLFGNYRNVLLNSQKTQLMNISESVANSISVYLEDYQQTVKSIVSLETFSEAEKEFAAGNEAPLLDIIDHAGDVRGNEVVSIVYESPRGQKVFSGADKAFTLHRELGSDAIFDDLCIEKDADGNFCFRIRAVSGAGGSLSFYLPLDSVYEKTASYIHMGEDGYVMIKDSSGIILMHPVADQIGIDVLADRKVRHPDFDFSELEVLIRHQLEGRSDVEIYHSYWWADDPPTRVTKVSAYLPLYMGEDFLSISAVMDYSEISHPIENMGIRILALSILLVIALIIFIITLRNAIRTQRSIEKENISLKQMNEELERLNQEEERMAEQQRLSLIGTMTSGIAHEFNNLLTPIMGYSAMILNSMDDADDNKEDMREIYDSAEKAKEIIDQLSQFSGKNAEKIFSPVHVSEAVRKALTITEAAAPRNVRITGSFDTENDLIMGNSLKIRQMIVNLCNNAIHAIGSAEGTIDVTGDVVDGASLKEPFFSDKKSMRFYRITVSDTGCGMSREVLENIFVPFYTTKKPGEGTGLGLAIVGRLTEAHRGYIKADSEEGVGTVFTLYLPLLEEEQTEKQA